jgi:hypothetical protein
MVLEVIITDFEHNPRQELMKRIEVGELSLGLIRNIMGDMKVDDTFSNYIIILSDGMEISYELGGSCISFPVSPPTETGKMLEAEVGRTISHTFENPHILTENKTLFGWKTGEEEYFYPTNIYQHNTVLVVDYKFKDVAVKALEDSGIKPHLNFDYRQLSLF